MGRQTQAPLRTFIFCHNCLIGRSSLSRACRLRMEGHTGTFSAPCIATLLTLPFSRLCPGCCLCRRPLIQCRRRQDSTYLAAIIFLLRSQQFELQVRMWETVHHDCISVLTGLPAPFVPTSCTSLSPHAGHTGYINALLAARGRIYSAGNDKTIRVWE